MLHHVYCFFADGFTQSDKEYKNNTIKTNLINNLKIEQYKQLKIEA